MNVSEVLLQIFSYIKIQFSVSLWLNIRALRLFFKCVFLQELNKVTAQLDQVTAKFQEKQEHCSQLENHLKEFKEKNLSLEQKAEDLEGQVRVRIKQLNLSYFLLNNFEVWSFTESKTWSNRERWSGVTSKIILSVNLYVPSLCSIPSLMGDF